MRAPSYWLRPNSHTSRYCHCIWNSKNRPQVQYRLPLCSGCGVNTSKINENYMVHNHIWETAFAAKHRECFSCIGCLEKALNRQLCHADFTLCPLNTHPDYSRSIRLQERLGIAN